MQFLVISKPRADSIKNGMPADFEQLETAEQKRLREMYTDGSARQVWARVRPERGAAVLFEAESPEHMQRLWGTFPLVEAGYADFEITQLAPYPGLGTAS